RVEVDAADLVADTGRVTNLIQRVEALHLLHRRFGEEGVIGLRVLHPVGGEDVFLNRDGKAQRWQIAARIAEGLHVRVTILRHVDHHIFLAIGKHPHAPNHVAITIADRHYPRAIPTLNNLADPAIAKLLEVDRVVLTNHSGIVIAAQVGAIAELNDRTVIVEFLDDPDIVRSLIELRTTHRAILRGLAQLDPPALFLDDGADFLAELLRLDHEALSLNIALRHWRRRCLLLGRFTGCRRCRLFSLGGLAFHWCAFRDGFLLAIQNGCGVFRKTFRCLALNLRSFTLYGGGIRSSLAFWSRSIGGGRVWRCTIGRGFGRRFSIRDGIYSRILLGGRGCLISRCSVYRGLTFSFGSSVSRCSLFSRRLLGGSLF